MFNMAFLMIVNEEKDLTTTDHIVRISTTTNMIDSISILTVKLFSLY